MASRPSRILAAAVETAEGLQIEGDASSADAFTNIEYVLQRELMQGDAAGPNYRVLFDGSFGVTSKGKTMPEELLGEIIGKVCWHMEYERQRYDSDSKASNILLYLNDRDSYYLP